MLNLSKHKKYIENLISSNKITIDFILNEIRKMSQVDKMKVIIFMTFVQNIRGLKYLLPIDKYREELTIADLIITPLKHIIDAELNELKMGESGTNRKENNTPFSLSVNTKKPEKKSLNQASILSNFNDWD